MTTSKHVKSKEDLTQKLSQMYDQGVVNDDAKRRIVELENLEELLPSMKKDDSVNKLLKLFKALSNKNRLLILWLIVNGVQCACELEHLLQLSQSTVSHHINSLVDVGAIEAIKSGKWNLVETQKDDFSKEFFISLISEIFS